MDDVKDKTLEECEQHNREVITSGKPYTWLDFWEYEYKSFISVESSEDDDEDDYILAGKILLGDA